MRANNALRWMHTRGERVLFADYTGGEMRPIFQPRVFLSRVGAFAAIHVYTTRALYTRRVRNFEY